MRFALITFACAFACSTAGCLAADGGEIGGTSDDSDSSPADDSGASGGDTSVAEEDSVASTDDTGSSTVDTGSGGAKDTGTTSKDTGTSTKDSGGTPPDSGSGSLDEARVFCVDEINKYRATLSLAPYAGWTSAGTCADAQSKSDSESGKAHGAFGKCGEFAQNECPGWPGPPDSLLTGCLKMMWDEGPGEPFSAHGHYINMSSTSYTSVACGFYKTPTGNWWAVQDFK
jgi:hypothetical protein